MKEGRSKNERSGGTKHLNVRKALQKELIFDTILLNFSKKLG